MKKQAALNIGLYGGSGKMGLEVEKVLQEKAHTPLISVGKKKSSLFALTVDDLNNIEAEILADIDVWIDFTSGEGLLELLSKTEKTPVVSGSTGFSGDQLSKVKKYATKRPLFWASNMSVGLWCFRQAMKSFAQINDFDFSIDEIHHNQKKDKPSGTALTLHGDLQEIVGKKIDTPAAHRLGGVFGIHTVYAASPNEIMTFQHQALNRKVFAAGAVRAAEWVMTQKNGFYSMDDMLLQKGK